MGAGEKGELGGEEEGGTMDDMQNEWKNVI